MIEDITQTIEWGRSLLPIIEWVVIGVPAVIVIWSIFNSWNITRNF